MNKLFTGIVLLLIVFTAQSAVAQKLDWHGAKKMRHGLYQYPIGQDDGVTYRLGADVPLFGYDGAEIRKIGHFYILKYTNGAEKPEAIKVKSDYELYRIDACYISDKKIMVLYKTFKGGYSVDYYADIFDENGARQKTVALFDKKTNRDKPMMDKHMYIIASENNNWFLMRFGEVFKMFDKNLDKKWERDIPKEEINLRAINVTNAGGAVMLAHDKDNDKSCKIVSVDANNKLTEIKMGADGDIYYDPENDLVYAATYNGAMNKGHLFHYGEHTDLVISKSFSYSVYQGADMKKLDEQKDIAFHDNIVKQAMDKDAVDGLVGLKLYRVILSGKGSPVFVFNTQANVISGEFSMSECILLVKIVNDQETVQKLITKISKDQKMRYIISDYNVFYNGKDICLLYYTDENNKQVGHPTLNIRTYTADLEVSGNSELDPKTVYGYTVDITHFYRQPDHSYLFFGLATNTKMGSTSLTF